MKDVNKKIPDTNGLVITTLLNTKTSGLVKTHIMAQKLVKLKMKLLIMMILNELLLKNLIS